MGKSADSLIFHSDTRSDNFGEDITPGVRETGVTAFYALRRELIGVDLNHQTIGFDDFLRFIVDNQIIDPATDRILSAADHFSREGQRRVLHILEERYLRFAPDHNEHASQVLNIVRSIQESAHNRNVPFSISVVGSLATGKIPHGRSDMDFLIGLPDGLDDATCLKEMLADLHFVHAPLEGDYLDVQKLMTRGDGYTRLCGVMGGRYDVLTEMIVLGERSLRSMDKLHPGYVQRILPSPAKVETYRSLDNPQYKRQIMKPPDRVPNFYTVDGEHFLGFLPTVMLNAMILHDPSFLLEESQSQLWQALTRSHLFHNGGFVQDARGWTIKDSVLQADPGALSYLWYSDLSDYSEQEAHRVRQLHQEGIRQMVAKPWVKGIV